MSGDRIPTRDEAIRAAAEVCLRAKIRIATEAAAREAAERPIVAPEAVAS